MKKHIHFFQYALLLLVLTNCTNKEDAVNSLTPDWTTDTHSNDVPPNYTVVFPEGKVNALQIKMTLADWQAIRADMTKNSGADFGVGGATQGGGMNPPAGGGAGGGLDIIPGDPIYVATSVKYNNKEWYKVGFRLKGNSSLSTAWRSGIYKLPFRLKFDEYETSNPEIKNQRFYGFKELSFAPSHNDNSLMRDKIAADLFRAGGIPAAKVSFCKVYIDFGEGLKYCGVYNLIEVIDDTMIKEQFGNDKGNTYKPESNFAANTFATAKFEKKNNETAADWSDIQAIYTALHAANRKTDPATWRSKLEAVFNVEHFLKYLAINNSIVNWDAYGALAHNYYLYNDPTKKMMWIPWDHNLSMQASSNTAGGQAGGMGRGVSLEMTEVANTWPLIRFLADDPVYYAKYKVYMKDFNDNVFTPARVNTMLDQNFNLIQPFVTGTEAEQPKYTHLKAAADFPAAITILKQHVVTRNQAVRDFLK